MESVVVARAKFYRAYPGIRRLLARFSGQKLVAAVQTARGFVASNTQD
jgi:hypothetical protein